MDIKDILLALDTGEEGLPEAEAGLRKEQFGSNQLEEGQRKTVVAMFFEQFKSIMVIILLIAAAISGFMGELTDAIIILAVVMINAVLGVVQESKAEKALAALKKMAAPYVKTKRNGQVQEVRTEDLVPGDIVILEAGDFVPADLRLLKSASLKIEEAALTGESVPVDKETGKLEDPDLVIGDLRNMAYSGSSVTYGRGMGVVTATGMNTEVGKIAGHLSRAEVQSTPLQKKLSAMSRVLSVVIVGVSIVIFLAGILQGRDYLEMFLTAVSLAVAAIPEGLPAVITIVLALGVQKMAQRNAIVRKLSAVETLGCTEIICSDKTGTLTQNKMTVQEVYLNGKLNPELESGQEHGPAILMQAMALCNDSKPTRNQDNSVDYKGDPTETALAKYAAGHGFPKHLLDDALPRVNELPFDSGRKLMSTIHQFNERFRVMTKGAPDLLLARCRRILTNGQVRPLSPALLEQIQNANREMARKALRVLAIAYKDLDRLPADLNSDTIESDLIFVGLTGMIDPPRPEAKAAVRTCIEAGIKPVMITGDHRDTAAAIAQELGISHQEEEIITGAELNSISDTELEAGIHRYSVFARVSPEHKVRIVNAWKKRGKIVAMTGDGVNDAPALKAADIGVGMGITGTDVAKGVANMVLADDNFATIVFAVEEGRKIYSNIQKTVQFLLSSNLGEVVTLFLGTMLNWVVLYPIHILWVNLITDTFPALALGVEPAEKGVMLKKPRPAESGFFAEGIGISIVYQGIIKGLITLSVFYTGIQLYSPKIAVTMTFVTLGLIQLTHSLNVRSNTKSLFQTGLFSNKPLIWAITLAAILQVGVVLIPGLNEVFRVESLSAVQWLIVLGAAVSIIPIVEIGKLMHNLILTGKIR
ncbi:MAG: calcium-translocating P-type ATPase, PMCA-type [Firmicutes bacterium]|nr:calcium-translocating P-type ATPase, PMCA-type [Bacillota bacterium]